MTQLIDKNALIAEYDRVHVGEAGKARQLMEEAPEVEAIPIDFIEKEAEKMRMSENPAMRMNSVILSALIRDWREK